MRADVGKVSACAAACTAQLHATSHNHTPRRASSSREREKRSRCVTVHTLCTATIHKTMLSIFAYGEWSLWHTGWMHGRATRPAWDVHGQDCGQAPPTSLHTTIGMVEGHEDTTTSGNDSGSDPQLWDVKDVRSTSSWP